MILATGRAAPLRFLIGVVLCWTLVRAAMVAGWRPSPLRPLVWGPPPGPVLDDWPGRQSPARGVAAEAGMALPAVAVVSGLRASRGEGVARPAMVVAPATPTGEKPIRLAAAKPDDHATDPAASDDLRIAPLVSDPGGERPLSATRLHGSAWLFLRGGAGNVPPLSPQGRIGGGQVGARMLYAVDDAGRLAVSARLSRAVGGPRQTEAAVGLDVQPLKSAALHLTVERRIAIDRGGRDAWAAGVSGGVYGLAVRPGIRLDGYGQAGIVGLHNRDLYADGAVRAGYELTVGERTSLTIGGGAWGAAQPGAARLDLGPSAVLRLPAGRTTLAVAVDYRGRAAGDARPGSGPAVTVGVDF